MLSRWVAEAGGEKRQLEDVVKQVSTREGQPGGCSCVETLPEFFYVFSGQVAVLWPIVCSDAWILLCTRDTMLLSPKHHA